MRGAPWPRAGSAAPPSDARGVDVRTMHAQTCPTDGYAPDKMAAAIAAVPADMLARIYMLSWNDHGPVISFHKQEPETQYSSAVSQTPRQRSTSACYPAAS